MTAFRPLRPVWARGERMTAFRPPSPRVGEEDGG